MSTGASKNCHLNQLQVLDKIINAGHRDCIEV